MASSSASTLSPDLACAEPIDAGRNAWFGTSSLVFLALVVGLFARPDKLLADPDTQWHVAVGRWIVAHGAVPWTDLFSHTFAGQPWIAKEWASQVVLFAVHAGAGWWGVAVCAVLVLASTLAVLHAWLGRRMSGASALVLVAATFVILAPHILYTRHGDLHVDAVTIERDGKPPKEVKLGTYKLAGLSAVRITPRRFAPSALFDPAAERYEGQAVMVVERN